MSKITVKDTEINVTKINDEDYICITDMLKAKDGDFFVTDWLRNRNTLEYIGTWESVYNPDFNFEEFSKITSRSGLNSFKISVKEFVERTNAISITAKAGRYGGDEIAIILPNTGTSDAKYLAEYITYTLSCCFVDDVVVIFLVIKIFIGTNIVIFRKFYYICSDKTEY